ncbi:hypothetical protein C8J57DRAFT_1468686 [Mycena rebaudengoi]|nr:hypothetical protein C8J57DRAFT_1468686 [Mycena rebaudengoi]
MPFTPSADLMCALIESEVASAVEPYQIALAELRRSLAEACSGKNITSIPGASLDPIYQAQEQELNELKSALAHSRGTQRAPIHRRARGLRRNPSSKKSGTLPPTLRRAKPICPATVVEILVQVLSFVADFAQRLEAADKTHLAEFSDREQAAKVLADGHRAEVAHLIEQRAELAMSLTRERSAASEVNAQVSQLKRTCIAVEEERDALKSKIDEGESYLTLVKAELESWKTTYSVAQEESKTAIADRDTKLASARAELKASKAEHLNAQEELQTRIRDGESELALVKVELDAWKVKCLAVLEELMTEDREGKLTSAQAEAQVWKTKCLAAQEELKNGVDENKQKLASVQSDLEIWKSKCRDADVRLEKAESSLQEANTQMAKTLDNAKIEAGKWAAKLTAWDNARTGYQQSLTDFQTKYRNLEQERDHLRTTLVAENAGTLTKVATLTAEVEEFKKKKASTASALFSSNPTMEKRNLEKVRRPNPYEKSPQIPVSTKDAIKSPTTPRGPFSVPTSVSSSKASDDPKSTPPSSPSAPSPSVPHTPVASASNTPRGKAPMRRPSGSSGPKAAQGSTEAPIRRKVPAPDSPAETLNGAQPLSRRASHPSTKSSASIASPLGQPRASAQQAPKPSPSTSSASVLRRPPLASSSSQPNASKGAPKPAAEASSSQIGSKRSAPSPLMSDRPKLPRTSTDSLPMRIDFSSLPAKPPPSSSSKRTSTTPSSSSSTKVGTDATPRPTASVPSRWTKPPTRIEIPTGQQRRLRSTVVDAAAAPEVSSSSAATTARGHRPPTTRS